MNISDEGQDLMRRALGAVAEIMAAYAIDDGRSLNFALVVWPQGRPRFPAYGAAGAKVLDAETVQRETREALRRMAETFDEHQIIGHGFKVPR